MTAPSPTAAVPPAAVACHQEADTIRAAAAGDARAFAQLVHSHSRRVHGFLFQFTRNAHDADDLTQQTFIKAYRHLGSFDCSRPLINWLLTIARRTALNHVRSARAWEPADDTIPGAEPSPAHSLEQAERSENLWTRARRLLSDREYEILWLRFAEDMSVEETARITGLTRIHVKVIAHRARARLAQGVPPA